MGTYVELAGAPNFKQIFIEKSRVGRYRIKHERRRDLINGEKVGRVNSG